MALESLENADQITETIWIGPTLDPSDVPLVHSLGVQRVINLEMEDRYPPGLLARRGIDLVRIPIPDANEPLSQDAIDRVIAAIHECASQGHPVYVHCTAGIARSTAVVACYLIFLGLTAEAAIAAVRERRNGTRFYPSHVSSVIDYGLSRAQLNPRP